MAATPGGQAPHKIIGLVVHGVGEQTRGSTLRSFVQNYFPLIRNRRDVVKAGIYVRPIDDTAVPQVRLTFTKTNGQKYEILVQEVHWAEAFVAPSFSGVLAGLVKLLTTWLRRAMEYQTGGLAPIVNIPFTRFLYLLYWLGKRLLRNATGVAFLTLLSIPAAILATVALLSGWKGRTLPWWSRDFFAAYAKFQPMLVELVIVLISPLLFCLFGVLVILERIGPLRELLPSWVGKIRTVIVSIGTSYLGDVWAYAGQPWEASQMRTRFETRFKDLIESEGKDAEAMFVIAHSLGCPVSYEALSSRGMGEIIAKEFTFATPQRPLYYFTVGSALPAIFRVIPDEESGRLYRTLPDHIHWEDFVTAYDPVQFSLIIDAMPQPSEVSNAKVKHKVTNQVDIFSDHNAYWNNAGEVLTPILDRITS